MISADRSRSTASRRARRVAVGVLAFTAAISLAACSSGPSTASSGSAGKPVHVGMVYYESSVNAFQEMAYGGTYSAKSTPGVTLTTAAPATENPTEQLADFQSTLQVAKDGIVLQTLRGDLFLRPVQQATSSGVPVIVIDAPVPAGSGSDLFVTNDNKALGVDLAKAILAKIPASATGEIVIGNNGPAVPPLIARVDGMKQEIEAERPDLTIVGPITTGTSVTDNLSSWSSILRAHPNALGYMAPSDQDAASIATLSRQSGKKYNAGGCDLDNTALQGVKDGYITALASPEHWLKGYIAMSILTDHAQNGTAIPKGTWITPALMVDSTNIDKIIARQKSQATRAAYFSSEAKEMVANPDKYLVKG
jgi:ABC-type sugar transport system substrate-binding protein